MGNITNYRFSCNAYMNSLIYTEIGWKKRKQAKCRQISTELEAKLYGGTQSVRSLIPCAINGKVQFHFGQHFWPYNLILGIRPKEITRRKSRANVEKSREFTHTHKKQTRKINNQK